MNTAKQIAIQRLKVVKNLLPDVCTITSATGANPTIVDGILVQGTRPNRLYNGQDQIPCRFDIDRAFRPDKFKTQATTVDEYTLEIPKGVTVEPSDIIDIATRHYIIRKIKDASEWDVTIECTVVEVGTAIDYGQSS